MPLSPDYYAKIVSRLNEVRPVTHRKMFGGGGVYNQDVFFAVLDDDKTFFKVDELTKAPYEALGMGPWICNGDAVDAYRELPASILGDDEKLGEWIDASVESARRRKGKKKK